MSRWILRALVGLAFIIVLNARAVDLAYAPARADNPLKGLIPSPTLEARHFPHSLRYVSLPLSALMRGENEFAWTRLDKWLERISTEGRQAVIRIYLDWPGQTNSIPDFLRAATQIPTPSGWRKSEPVPDYQNPLLRAALTNFVSAFGQRYDGHPDIGFIEAGLLGAWGEWLQTGRAASMASPQVSNEILAAYHAAFPRTKILVRYPSPASSERSFGHHDDWFGRHSHLDAAFATLTKSAPDWWLTSPMGGRLHPELQDGLDLHPRKKISWSEIDFASARTRHFTYLRFDHSQHLLRAGPIWKHALELGRSLGYEFHVATADFTFEDGSLKTKVTIRNSGAAPFYYPWPMELALLRNGAVLHQWKTDWDLRKIVPGDNPATFQDNQKRIAEPPGKYSILLCIRHPDRPKLYVDFANATQNADRPDWLTLGQLEIPAN